LSTNLFAWLWVRQNGRCAIDTIRLRSKPSGWVGTRRVGGPHGWVERSGNPPKTQMGTHLERATLAVFIYSYLGSLHKVAQSFMRKMLPLTGCLVTHRVPMGGLLPFSTHPNGFWVPQWVPISQPSYYAWIGTDINISVPPHPAAISSRISS
jgi:hypothetical protein